MQAVFDKFNEERSLILWGYENPCFIAQLSAEMPEVKIDIRFLKLTEQISFFLGLLYDCIHLVAAEGQGLNFGTNDHPL